MATWACPCGRASYSENDPDLIVRHVSECDYVDGAGQPIDLAVKFSVVHYYIATVRSDKLAEVTGGLPFRDLRGQVEDGFEDENNKEAVAEFLNSLTEAEGPVEADGFEVHRVYDARRDHPREPLPGASTVEGQAVKHTVYEKRPEIIVYEIEASDAADAEARYLKDGEETGSYLDGDTGVTVEPATVRRGQCEFCREADAALVAVLSGDPDQGVCEACHADPRLPTVSLAVVSDSRPAYVVSHGDLARIAGREVTDSEAARIVKAIDNSTASEAIGEAIAQVCGYPAEPDESR
jgi:hypothetical protein